MDSCLCVRLVVFVGVVSSLLVTAHGHSHGSSGGGLVPDSGPRRCGRPPLDCPEPNDCINDVCTCPEGWSGDGRIHCIPPGHHAGGVGGDPKISTYDNQTAHIHFPCRFLLTHVRTTHEHMVDTGICDFKVFGLNYHIDGGYFMLGVDLEMRLSNNSAHDKDWRAVGIRVQGFEHDGDFEYIEYGKDGTLSKMKKWGEKTHLTHMGIHVESRLNDTTKLVHLDVPECGLLLAFRAYVRNSYKWPGVVIGVKDKPGLEFLDHEETLMSHPFNFGEARLRALQHGLGMTLAESALYLALSQDVPQDFGTGAIPCTIASKQFSHVCETPQKKAFALKMCSFLFTQKNISTCLMADAFGESVGSMFGLCTQVMCTASGPNMIIPRLLCEDVKDTLNCYHCVDVPQFFQDLDCNNITAKYNELYPS